MRVLVTGATGFLGSNLCAALACVRDGLDQRPQVVGIASLEVLACGRAIDDASLRTYAAQADFVFHLAGVNRPTDPADFMRVNADVTQTLMGMLEAAGNACPVMLASSAQASAGHPATQSPYAASKRAAEAIVLEHAVRTGSRAMVYRLPNVFGKWCKPDYNSVVATFCDRAARGLPLEVREPQRMLDLLYVDDFVDEMLRCLAGSPTPARTGEQGFCEVDPVHRVSVRELAGMVEACARGRAELDAGDQTPGSLAKKINATFMSYVPPGQEVTVPPAHTDERGSFVELVRSCDRGQVSVNVIRPGQTKGQHWHHTKWERFCVVSGEGLIRTRSVRPSCEDAPVAEHRVSGTHIELFDAVPGRTHSVTNVSADQDLVMLVWCSEAFDPLHPDTYREEV